MRNKFFKRKTKSKHDFLLSALIKDHLRQMDDPVHLLRPLIHPYLKKERNDGLNWITARGKRKLAASIILACTVSSSAIKTKIAFVACDRVSLVAEDRVRGQTFAPLSCKVKNALAGWLVTSWIDLSLANGNAETHYSVISKLQYWNFSLHHIRWTSCRIVLYLRR